MWLRLTQANESGEEVGPMSVNSDNIAAIIPLERSGIAFSVLRTTDCRVLWTMETLEQIEAKMKQART
jgi:hypothetical protein